MSVPEIPEIIPEIVMFEPPDATQPQPKRPKPKTRVTVLENVHVQAFGEMPVTPLGSAYHFNLESEDQPYSPPKSKSKATSQWQPLDFGWIKQPGMLVLTNDAGKNLQRIPTDEEVGQIKASVIQLTFCTAEEIAVGLNIGDVEIAPGESCRFSPGHKELHVRSANGVEIPYRLSVLPR